MLVEISPYMQIPTRTWVSGRWTQRANQSVYFGNAPRFGMIFNDFILNAEDVLVAQPVHELARKLGFQVEGRAMNRDAK